jgi:hypothetical protein
MLHHNSPTHRRLIGSIVPELESPVVLEARGMKAWLAIKGGLLRHTVAHVKAVDGIDLIDELQDLREELSTVPPGSETSWVLSNSVSHG